MTVTVRASTLAGSGVASWWSGWPWMLSPVEAFVTLAAAVAVAAAASLHPAAHAERLFGFNVLLSRAKPSESKRLW